ncbi:MAG: sterol desaturase family protein [Gammaproteobacteria bacterium]|nr:sterol desaturase family protein [Gammaproteobacteria bacterium]
MEFLTKVYTEMEVYAWDESFNNWFFLIALIFLVFEFLRLVVKGKFKLNILTDAITNFITLYAFIGLNFLLGGFYLATYYFFYNYVSITHIPITMWSIVLCIVLADLIYYCEHRFMHRVGFGWATHTVHHSSPYFNISVAYRFGPLDGLIPLVFSIPLAMLGFNPFLIFFAEIFVQLYQTALHTEVVRKLPKFVEAIMNTPSHHRVHHGSNKKYIDKNYGGIFIIWDKMFGTFEEEQEEVVYGITRPIESVNPFVVFFHGFTRLFGKMVETRGWRNKIGYLFMPPGWEPERDSSVSRSNKP